MKTYSQYIARKTNEFAGTEHPFDPSELAPQFVSYFETGQRIEVDFGDGMIKRGTVGVTTGWRPVFLLVLRSNSMGSSWTLGKNDRIVKIIR